LPDFGGEDMSHEFQEYLQQNGIVCQNSCTNTAKKYGIVERKNHHLLDVTNTLLL